jgi:DNA-binding CsgD family transcriptional regulator
LGVGTIILDQTGSVTRTNAVADQLLDAGDGIRLECGKLILEDRRFQKTIESLLTHIGDTPAPVRFKLSRAKGHDLAVVARPIHIPAILRGGANLALFITVPGDDTQLDPAAIRDLFQLTRMEATLAVSLANGRSLVEAADTLGIAHNTARAHLRSIFAKTGARRQSQLVHLLRSGLQ